MVGLDWLLMNLAGYPLLFRAWGDDSFYSRVTFVYHGKGDGEGKGGKRWKGGGGDRREEEGKGMGPSYVGITAEKHLCVFCKFANMLGNNPQIEQYADNYVEICFLILIACFHGRY